MDKIRTYKYRLYPTKRQIQILDRQLNLCRLLYNKMLKQRIDVYKKKGITLRYKHQQPQLPLLKDNKPEYKDIYAQVLQVSLRTLDLAFQSFFRRLKTKGKAGFPRFKGRYRMTSLCYPQSGFSFDDQGKLKLSKIGHIKIKKHREIEGDIKTCTIKKTTTGKWYVCFSVKMIIEKPKVACKTQVGLDLGINTFAMLSDGNKIETVKHLKQKKKQLVKAQRILAKKKRGSKNRHKARHRVALVHEQVANSRMDFLHKASRKLVNSYDRIVFENLKISNMTRSSRGTVDNPGKMVKQKAGLNRNMLDMSWGLFLGMITYKAEEAGKEVVGVDPRNTSQLCSQCGSLVTKALSDREHSCPFCSLKMDRDLNASINILNRYTAVGATVEACGGDCIGKPLRQETPLMV